MAVYFIFSSQEMIDFSNGKKVRGSEIGNVDNSETYQAVNQDEVAALNTVISAGYNLLFVNGWAQVKNISLVINQHCFK